jgi:hypothetical protein
MLDDDSGSSDSGPCGWHRLERVADGEGDLYFSNVLTQDTTWDEDVGGDRL